MRSEEKVVKLGHPVCHGRRVVNKTNCVNDRDIDMGDTDVLLLFDFYVIMALKR